MSEQALSDRDINAMVTASALRNVFSLLDTGGYTEHIVRVYALPAWRRRLFWLAIRLAAWIAGSKATVGVRPDLFDATREDLIADKIKTYLKKMGAIIDSDSHWLKEQNA